MYVDGVAINTTGAATPTGDFSNWSGDYVITLFNEYGASRKWLGEMALAAIYDRALTPEEITQNYDAGYQSGTGYLAPGETLEITKVYTVQAEDTPSFTNMAIISGKGVNGCMLEVGEPLTITVDGATEICDNGIDDDGDGLIDCYDLSLIHI